MASLVHRLSKDAVRPELDLFSPPNTQTSIERGYYQEYMPMNALNNSSAIQFCISGQGNDYIDLQHSLLFLRVKILSSNGSEIPLGAQVGPVNNLLHSLFSACEITLNGKIIGHLNNLYPYRAMLQTIGAYSNEAATGFLQGALFEKDTAGWMESTDITLPNKTHVIKGFDNPKAYATVVRTTDEATTTDHISIEYKIGNNGLNVRAAYTQRSQPVELIGPLFTDLTTQNRYILNNVDINVKLTRASNEFCLMSGDAEKYKVVIEEAGLFVRKVKLSDAAFMAHQTTLQSTNAIYPISYCQMKHVPIPQGNLNGPNENILLGHMPNELMVCFVEADAFNGSYKLNPFNFKDFKLSQISVRLNGIVIPSKPILLDYSHSDPGPKTAFARGFFSLFSDTHRLFSDRSSLIRREDYAFGYSIYCFNLRADITNSDQYSLKHMGALQIETRFSEPLPKSIYMIIMSTYDSFFEINADREIITPI